MADTKKKKKKNKALHAIGIFFKVVLIAVLICTAVVSGVIFGALAGYIENTDLLDVKNLSINLTSFIYAEDPNGNIVQLEALYDEENRVWADISEIPLYLQRAFIAIEDERFFSHKGFDLKRTLGATFYYIKDKITGTEETSFGGSTLTQQFIKNVTKEKDYSPTRKIREIYRAYKLEQELSKNEILELYLNTIYLSQGCNGVKSAAKAYFNKELYELTLAESASLAAITQFPTKYDPRQNPENNKERRNVVLQKMYELDFITLEERDEAMAAEIVTVPQSESSAYSSSTTTYYTDALIEQLVKDLAEVKNCPESLATQMLYSGGYKIYSAIDLNIQSIMDAYYASDSNFPSVTSEAPIQSAMVVIDPATGYVKGVVGGRGVKEGSRTLNRATQALRQSGSSIKPLSIYAPAIEYGKITPSTIVSDSPITINGWSPRNDDNRFRGNMSVSSALVGSRNVPAIRILQYLGLERSFNFVKRNFHISTLVENETRGGKVYSDKDFSPIGLGGLTDGVTVLEMAAAFVPFDSKGCYYEPAFYTRVEDSEGNVIIDRSPRPYAALSETTAYQMTQMLSGAVRSGTGMDARLSNMPAAGKTGTTTNSYDRWFVGYTPYYVGAVWYGYDISRNLSGLSGNPAAKVWKGVMEGIHKNLPYKEFNTVGQTSNVLVCADSGLLPNSTCENLTFGEYSKNAAPKTRCNRHAEIDDGEGRLVVYTAPKPAAPSVTTPEGGESPEVGESPEGGGDGGGSASPQTNSPPIQTPIPPEAIPPVASP